MSVVVRQYAWSEPFLPSASTLTALLSGWTNVFEIRPAAEGQVRLRALDQVGAIRIAGLDIVIQPKVPTASVLWLLGRADGLAPFRADDFSYDQQPEVLEVLARLFGEAMRRLLRQGLYRRYLEVEENLGFVRGRLLPLETLRAGRGLHHRFECRFSELTHDVPHNRLLRAAAEVLANTAGLQATTRARLNWVLIHLSDIGTLRPTDQVDRLTFDRLNLHYRPAVRLATWILSRTTFQPALGSRAAPAFLINMNDLWERNVRLSLVEAGRARGLRLSTAAGFALDVEETLRAVPDVVLVDVSGRPAAVFDAKYKLTSPESDIYQAFAYAKVLGLPEATLVYPEDGEVAPRVHTIRRDGTLVRVATLPIGAGADGYQDLEARMRASAMALLAAGTADQAAAA